MLKNKIKCDIEQIEKHLTAHCDNCNTSHHNLFITSSRAYKHATYLFVHRKALPFCCTTCKLSYKMKAMPNVIHADLKLQMKEEVLT